MPPNPMASPYPQSMPITGLSIIGPHGVYYLPLKRLKIFYSHFLFLS
jgi:hypothetical protein